MPPTSRILLLGFLLTLACPTAWAQIVDDVFPFEPEDGAVVGPRPRLRVGVDGSDVTKMRFKIEMSRDGFDTIEHSFDQKEDRHGWGFVWVGFDQPGAMYSVRKPLDNGVWEWRASAWNGIEWVDGNTVYELTVDSVPPAEVSGLRVDIDRDSGDVILDWEPVVEDQQGGTEDIAFYHIYRYPRRSVFLVAKLNWIATVEGTRFIDDDPNLDGMAILTYKVVAEDRAGNVTGQFVFKKREPVHRTGAGPFPKGPRD